MNDGEVVLERVLNRCAPKSADNEVRSLIWKDFVEFESGAESRLGDSHWDPWWASKGGAVK